MTGLLVGAFPKSADEIRTAGLGEKYRAPPCRRRPGAAPPLLALASRSTLCSVTCIAIARCIRWLFVCYRHAGDEQNPNGYDYARSFLPFVKDGGSGFAPNTVGSRIALRLCTTGRPCCAPLYVSAPTAAVQRGARCVGRRGAAHHKDAGEGRAEDARGPRGAHAIHCAIAACVLAYSEH